MGEYALIPIVAIFCTIGLPVSAFMLFRVLSHRERMEMIRRGVSPDVRASKWSVPPPPPAPGMAMGAATGKRKKNCRDGDELEAPMVTLRKGIRLTMIGVALTVGLSFIGFDDGSIHPGPWLLGGLIPMFVGISQVILALLAGAAFTPGQQWSATGTQPPPSFAPGPPGPSAPGPTYDSSYTYRPGDLQELQPPGSPPDRR